MLFVTACYSGREGHWKFVSSDGTETEGKCRVGVPGSAPWDDAVGLHASGTLTITLVDGPRVVERTLVEGRREGKEKLWNEDGQQIMDADFIAGELDGRYITWYDDGQKAGDGFYAEGREIGTHSNWYQNGHVKRVAVYSNGVLHGRCREWNPEGKVIADAVYEKHRPITGTVVIERKGDRRPLLGRFADGKLIEGPSADL